MDELPPKRPFSKVVQEKLAASRFFTFSMLLHVIIVVMGGSVVLFKQYIEPPDFTSSGDGIVSSEVTVAPPQEQPQMEQQFVPETPTITAPTIPTITTAATNPTAFQMAAVPVKAMPSDMAKSIDVSKAMTRGIGSGLPSSMAGRAGGSARAQMMKQAGGKEKSEKAVMAGLRWLKEHQSPEGSWSPRYKPSMTGFALLCFLGHGETPESPEFGATVKKGVDWLLEKGTEFEGRLSLTKEGWGGNEGVYQHAIATYALAEYYTMTKDERVTELVKQGLTYIVQGQAPDGGWQYGYEKSPNSDTSVSGWQIQALKAGHLTGLSVPGVDEALDKAMLNLKRVQGPKGGFGYRKAEDKYSLTGVGVLCTYFWKQDKDQVVRDGLDFMLDNSDREFPVKYKHDKADLYAWYYNTQACLMYGGRAWTRWNRLFQDEITDNQNPDGSWPPVAAKDVAGAETQREAGGAGPYYRTTLCILMLEVFYRYMPINK